MPRPRVDGWTRCWPMPGAGLGRGFLDQDPRDWRRVVDTNITGTLLLMQKVGRDMRARGRLAAS